MLQQMQKYKSFVGMRIPDQVFENVYATSSDPYGFASSDYERRKYFVTIAALSRARYTNAFEIGCSVGVLTRLLGERCESLLSVDIVERALQQQDSDAPQSALCRYQRLRH